MGRCVGFLRFFEVLDVRRHLATTGHGSCGAGRLVSGSPPRSSRPTAVVSSIETPARMEVLARLAKILVAKSCAADSYMTIRLRFFFRSRRPGSATMARRDEERKGDGCVI